MFVYAGTQAAQLNWALSLARQFGGRGVTVNNLAPGAILTARNRDQMAIEGEALAQRITAGRLGQPDDLVGAAMLLCSDAGRYINGVNLFVLVWTAPRHRVPNCWVVDRPTEEAVRDGA
jgi:NAD(P)-dependent dehydrogenase (short-subunit alcohol dehydrogenase family)